MILQLQLLPLFTLPTSKKSEGIHRNFIRTFACVKPSTTLPNLSSSSHLKDPAILLREKIKYIEDFNIDVSKALNQNPALLSAPIDSIKSAEKCLYAMGVQRHDLSRIFRVHPQLLTADPITDLYPIFDFLLNEVCIPYHQIRLCISRCPRLMVCRVDDRLRPTFNFLKGLGFVGQWAINYRTALLLVSSVEDVHMPKIEYLENLGFSHEEVITMILRAPALLTLSIPNNFQPKLDYFLVEMKGDINELKKFPHYFTFSLESRIKRRHHALVDHGLSLSLLDMLLPSDERFQARLNRHSK